MREILFKAKRIDNGEWVYGNYAFTDTFGGKHWIFQNKAFDHEVDPNTLCQFTGLFDKNGNKIWENDVVGEYSEYRKEWYLAKVTYGHFNCSCCDGVYGWTFENGDIRDFSEYEVKGNVFDNPELLGGAQP